MKRAGVQMHGRRGEVMSEEPLHDQNQACRNLLAAIIHRAADDMIEARPVAPYGKCLLDAERDKARRWVKSTETAPFSFEWCCVMLDMNPERMRTGIIERVGA